MAERKTETTISIYSGVPFNNKYKNVLFVSRETRDTFLSSYEIGTDIKVNRFEIVDDTQAMIDVETDYAIIANYCKVHRKLMPLSNENVYEYDSFYFVNRCVQIATNVVRLYLEIDAFQTYFNRYDYQAQAYEIPQIKNSNLITTTGNYGIPAKNIVEPSDFNGSTFITPLIAQSDQNTKKVKAIFHFTTKSGEFIAISKTTFNIDTGNAYPYDLSTLMSSIYSKQKFYIDANTQEDIDVLKIWLIPYEYLDTADFTLYNEGFYRYNYAGSNLDIKYYISTSNAGIIPTYTYSKSTTITSADTDAYVISTVGTQAHQIELPYNSQSYTVKIDFVFGNSFQMFLNANNSMIEITDDFEFSLPESVYGEYVQQHENGLAIKQISTVINTMISGASLFAGNPAGIIPLTKSIENVGSEIANIKDLKKQPLQVKSTPNCITMIKLANGIGIYGSLGFNFMYMQRIISYFGKRVQNLISKSFSYGMANILNFEYIQFSDVEIIAKIPENFKHIFETMFTNGVRIWYRSDNFLNTIDSRYTPPTP